MRLRPFAPFRWLEEAGPTFQAFARPVSVQGFGVTERVAAPVAPKLVLWPYTCLSIEVRVSSPKVTH